ncbi:hypothetical protein N0B16_08415 [Chryseobacterium sp. GMJ5]|uniref:TonB C-terminal domain-containing protein n=1 Tax=Chryseobacterium gilvum TaxID=2976534 RepID=A0ABT2VWU1_9FLAO|nr:hypothetical protein [Chryseobacterium gilvum]MCU7614461.1 hypothetical protein [Chryseobacterium gilvum]
MKKALFLFGIICSIFCFSQKNQAKNPVYTHISEIPNYAVLKTRLKLDDVAVKADQAPEFPGGMALFKRLFTEKMDNVELKNNQKLDTRIYFIVEKDGYIRNVVALGSDKKHTEAAELGLKRVFIRWKPAMIGDKKVRYLYTFPLTTKKY